MSKGMVLRAGSEVKSYSVAEQVCSRAVVGRRVLRKRARRRVCFIMVIGGKERSRGGFGG